MGELYDMSIKLLKKVWAAVAVIVEDSVLVEEYWGEEGR